MLGMALASKCSLLSRTATQLAGSNVSARRQSLARGRSRVAVRTMASDSASSDATKVWVVYYSMYGHIANMAQAALRGVNSVDGVEGSIFQVAETLPQEVLDKMHAPPKPKDIPVVNPFEMQQADGFLFGIPTRFGQMPAQMKAVFDATGGQWIRQELKGKTAGTFVSTSTQGGGQETTHLTTITQFAHHGMIYVPTGYGFLIDADHYNSDSKEIRGGSAYGAGSLAGPAGDRQPSDLELKFAEWQGRQLAEVTKALKLGRAALGKASTGRMTES